MNRTSKAASRSRGSNWTGPVWCKSRCSMMMLRLHDRPAIVHQHGKATERPERCTFFCRTRFFQMSVGEGDFILPKRDQHLLAVGGEGVRIERQRH